MAQIVNLRQGEYNEIANVYMNLHAETISAFKSILTKYRENISSDGCFFADSTSSKISGMLDTFETEILALIEESFTTGEQGISNMIDAMTATDSPC